LLLFICFNSACTSKNENKISLPGRLRNWNPQEGNDEGFPGDSRNQDESDETNEDEDPHNLRIGSRTFPDFNPELPRQLPFENDTRENRPPLNRPPQPRNPSTSLNRTNGQAYDGRASETAPPPHRAPAVSKKQHFEPAKKIPPATPNTSLMPSQKKSPKSKDSSEILDTARSMINGGYLPPLAQNSKTDSIPKNIALYYLSWKNSSIKNRLDKISGFSFYDLADDRKIPDMLHAIDQTTTDELQAIDFENGSFIILNVFFKLEQLEYFLSIIKNDALFLDFEENLEQLIFSINTKKTFLDEIKNQNQQYSSNSDSYAHEASAQNSRKEAERSMEINFRDEQNFNRSDDKLFSNFNPNKLPFESNKRENRTAFHRTELKTSMMPAAEIPPATQNPEPPSNLFQEEKSPQDEEKLFGLFYKARIMTKEGFLPAFKEEPVAFKSDLHTIPRKTVLHYLSWKYSASVENWLNNIPGFAFYDLADDRNIPRMLCAIEHKINNEWNNLNFDDCFLNFINYNGVYSSLRYFFLDIANDVLFLDFNKELNQLHDSLSTKIDFINDIQTSRTNQKNSSCMKSQASEALKATPKIQISFEKTLNPITS
jgi:hypothetical protein